VPPAESSLLLRVIEHIIAGLMANGEESQTITEEFGGLRRAEPADAGAEQTGRLSRFLNYEWSPAALHLLLDVVSWVAMF